MSSRDLFILSIDDDVSYDLRAIHSRITDNDATVELHSADIAALSASMQSLSKRLQVCEAIIAFHCGFEVKDLREVADEIKSGSAVKDSHELGAPDDEGYVADLDIAVPGD